MRQQNRLQNRQHAGDRELFPGSSRLTRHFIRSAATAYDRARYRWSIGAERWRTRRDEQELRAQGSLIHLDLRLSFTVLALWAFTAAALTVGTWRVVHPLACVLIALLGCLAILLFFPPRAVMPYSLLFRTTGQLVFLACIVTVQAVLLCATGVDASRATLQQAQGASLRLNGTVEQVRRVDPRTTLVVIKLEEIQGRSVRALVNERVRVYRRDGSAKSTAQRPEARSAASSVAQHQGSGTVRSRAIYPGMRVTALGTVEFNGSTAKLSGATIFPAPASGAGSNATAQTAAEPYLSTVKEQLRTRALDTLGTESAALVLGTAYGDDSLMSSTAREEYKLSGLSHITAVSGANIAIVFLGAYRLVLAIRPYRLASAYLLFRSWMQRLRGRSTARSRRSAHSQQPTPPNAHALPPLVHRLSTLAIPHRVMVLCGVAAVLAYAMLLDSEGSVIRSLAMGLLGAYAMLRGSGRQSLAALQTTVLICLLAAPHLAVDMGFALSVTATSALILLGPPLIRLLMRVMPVFCAEMLAAPIVASLWCTPLILAMSGKVPLYSVPANLVAAPLAPLSMLAGLAALGFMILGLPALADVCLRAGGLAAQGIEWAAHTAAHAPGNPWEPGSSMPALVCSALCVLALSIALWWVDARRYRAVTHRQYLRVVPRTARSHQRPNQPARP
ncbi:ComEC/Rec2 family competence protein [Rothia sp. (in: high G+C Gram-positive bacteria)]|uniref:ComEC/Rec2 family competence protein n=1 Tax=Rothia sp. (in: high G+C Gram-positive bacteria) TaxID=1885016 RepID=UPI001CB4E1F4|nr:ComEC/Rec2 family competence protein [Rothia sp. (in: high G+C Gram-positive bacteria)]MBF1655619.1 ComEC/Rec2 family competence protein [Rothia sp. (in: high G+C Gram-positive bacteria)]